MSDIGSRLKAARKRRGLTQKALAKHICKSTSAVSGYENNEQIPPVDVLVSIARLLNISIDYLVGLESEKAYSVRDLTPAQAEIIDDLFKEFSNARHSGPELSKDQVAIIQKLLLLFSAK